MKIKLLLIFLLILFFACSSSEVDVQKATKVDVQKAIAETLNVILTNIVTYTPYPTYTKVSTYTPFVVTPEFTTTFEFSSTPENTQTAMPDPLYRTKKPGNYLAGVDIAYGHWRSQGGGDYCYWEVQNASMEIMDNYIGMAGVTMYLRQGAYQVMFAPECGDWVYIDPVP